MVLEACSVSERNYMYTWLVFVMRSIKCSMVSFKENRKSDTCRYSQNVCSPLLWLLVLGRHLLHEVAEREL